MPVTLAYDSGKLALGAGNVYYNRRGVTAPTVTPTGTPTTTTFSIVASADMVAGQEKLKVGDVLQLASATPTYTATEASTMPKIVSLTLNGSNYDVVVSPAFASAPAASAGSVRVLYKCLGATDGDISIDFDVTRSEQTVDQSPFVVAAPVTAIKAVVNAPLVEQTSKHLALTLGLPHPTSDTALSVSGTPDMSREDRILAIIPAPGGLNFFLVAQKCVSQGKASMTASKTKKGVYNMGMGMMPDTSLGSIGLFDLVAA